MRPISEADTPKKITVLTNVLVPFSTTTRQCYHKLYDAVSIYLQSQIEQSLLFQALFGL